MRLARTCGINARTSENNASKNIPTPPFWASRWPCLKLGAATIIFYQKRQELTTQGQLFFYLMAPPRPPQNILTGSSKILISQRCS